MQGRMMPRIYLCTVTFLGRYTGYRDAARFCAKHHFTGSLDTKRKQVCARSELVRARSSDA